MICYGIDPGLAAWLAEQNDGADQSMPRLLPFVVLVATGLAFALAASFGHA